MYWRDLLLSQAGTLMKQSNGCIRLTPDSPTYLGANVKPKVAARKFTKPGFQDPKLVVLRIDQAIETQCTVMRTEAVLLDRSTPKIGVNRSLANGKSQGPKLKKQSKEKIAANVHFEARPKHLTQIIVPQAQQWIK